MAAARSGSSGREDLDPLQNEEEREKDVETKREIEGLTRIKRGRRKGVELNWRVVYNDETRRMDLVSY